MTTEDFKRKLTAILSADVVGYSRLMGEDESATVKTLEIYKGVMNSLIRQHRGRVVDSPGDNLLAEFGSVVDAVQCAVSIQKDLKTSNADLPQDRKMKFRIGINTGDVIQHGDRIYGEGVNVAARIESLADPGGVCISGIVYTQVKNKLQFDYEFIGKQTVKNISEPIPVYRVKAITETKIHQDADNVTEYMIDNKPSIVVLPFVNMSNDPDQEYFSDGMTEELINVLAKLEGLKVISRTSSFFFKGKDVDLHTIREKLGVENVLEGSVRKAGNKLRITAQLIKVADDTHLWSDAYNRELEDVFAIQEEISNAIVDCLKIRLLGKEKESLVKIYTENNEAYEAYIKGRYFYQSFREDSMEKALQYYEQAIRLDPGYAPAYSAIAEYYMALQILLPEQHASNTDTYKKAVEAVNTALDIDNNLPEAHANLGLIKWAGEWYWGDAEKAFETAIHLNPGLSKAHYDYANYLAISGNAEKAIMEARKAVELDPLYGLTHFTLGLSLLTSGQIEQAVSELQQAREMMPVFLPALLFIIQAYCRKGMYEEAIAEINNGLETFPGSQTNLLCFLGQVCAFRNEKEKAQAILDEILIKEEKEYVSPHNIARLYIELGELDKAYEYLDEAYEKRDIYLPPFITFYRNDHRFDAFFKKIGLR